MFLYLPSFALAAFSFSTPISALQSPIDLCGDYDYIILQDSPWIVYNMLYNADVTVGTQCTYYDHMTTSSSGVAEVVWDSITNIEFVESTYVPCLPFPNHPPIKSFLTFVHNRDNIPKGYSFIGLTQNLATPLSSITSIPTTYNWTRSNTTAFKGNICYDFITNDVAGDSTSTDSHELMLWLQYVGGQLPIGWGTPTATIPSLFGTSWDLYEGVNEDTGITVSSFLPQAPFEGFFEGDLMEWLWALVELGRFGNQTYVDVGNAG